MTDLLAGTRVTALDTPVTVADEQGPSFDTTSLAFTTASTGGTYADCAVVITAPTTGRIIIHTASRLINSGVGGAILSPEVREGSTIGSGTIADAAGDNHGPSHYGNAYARLGIDRLVTGLTPGSAYNVRLLHRATSGTASFAYRTLIVRPAT